MKKLLSIVLVMAMLLSLAIAIPVSADTTTETVSKWDGTIPTLATDVTYANLFEGEGTEASPYLIQSATDLAELAAFVNQGLTTGTKTTWGKYFELKCDIDIDDKEWPGIGVMTNTYRSAGTDSTAWANISNVSSFQGNFNGDGHVVYNLNLASNPMFAGFFNCITTATAYIHDFGIASGNISVEGVAYLGALVGYMSNNAKIENCFNAANIISTATVRISRIGGLVGFADRGRINGATSSSTDTNRLDNCWNSGNITITENSSFAMIRCGGIMGEKDYGGVVLKGCTNVGNIICNKSISNASSGLASLVGQTVSGSFVYSNVYAGGSISAVYNDGISEYIGSAVGYNLLVMVVESIYYDVNVIINGARQDSVAMCGFDNQSNATTNFTKVESITISDTTMLSNNFAQNGIDENAGNIRFVSELGFSAGAFSETGYVVEFATKSAEIGGKVVYTSLKAADAEAEGGYKTLTPTGKYYIAYGISDIPTDVSGTVTVTPYVVLLDGTTTVYGASAEYTITAGVLQQNS